MFLRIFACLFVILAVSPAFAQDDPNEVIARVNGMEVTRDEVATAILQLPAEYQQVPMEVLFEPILQQVIDRKLLAGAATADGIEDSPEYNQQITLLREELLQQLYLQAIVDAGLSEEALDEAYQQYVADYDAQGGGEEVHARHILVATEEEAQALVERLDAGEDFATLAQEASIGPSGPDGGDLGFFKK
jgi:peptidyl-prolyl cis-trans isomerase C